jgi:DNA-directed RNA polymerase subunit RPC12/RpoP
MATDSHQRAYRAACPGCGAPVEFRSAQSSHAVCGYCQSTVLRQGEVLSRIGKMAELFDDHSPLLLGASGKRDGVGFTLIGRLQYKSPAGIWTEWLVLQEDGTQAVLGEDNGAYVFAKPAQTDRALPEAAAFRVGATTAIGGKSFSVASNVQVALVSAQGELPRLPKLGESFSVVELRSDDGEVLSIEFSSKPPLLYRGRAVLLEDLSLAGLAQESAREEKGRQFACPNCGAPVTAKLAASKSISCAACNSLIDLSSGIGGELLHATQEEPVTPLIALGSMAQLQGQSWQVVGFQHRMGHEPGQGHDADEDGDAGEEHFGWSEYLLYNSKRGFIFVVDAEDGWSVVKPVTGAPVLRQGGQSAQYLGTTYKLKYSYQAETTYATGEFYWRVSRGQKTYNSDFAHGANLLSREQGADEITWSSGRAVSADAIAQAFKLEDRKEMLQRADALPGGGVRGLSYGTIAAFVAIGAVVLFASFCSECDPATQDCSQRGGGSGFARSTGGSWGGGSSGGGHK